MPVIRVEKNDNYTVMSNYHLRDKNLSLKGKGLLTVMLSLPPEWDYSINGLASIIKEGPEAVENVLKELKKTGYLEVTKMRDPKTGLFEYVYTIYEEADESRGVNPGGGLPPVVETPLKINTKEENTEINLYKEKNTKKEKSLDIKKMKPKEALEVYKEEFSLSPEIVEALEDFIDMRETNKDKLTARALKLAINKLFTLSSDPEKQVEIINQSVIGCWSGFFPLKENNQRQGGYQQPNRYDRAAEPEEEDALTRIRKRLEAEEAARKEEEARQNEYD